MTKPCQALLLCCMGCMVFSAEPLVYGQSLAENQAAHVLFAQYETVSGAATKGLFLLETVASSASSDGTVPLGLPYVELFEGVRALGPEAAAHFQQAYKEVLVGAKDFGIEKPSSSDGLGLVGSSKCYVGILTNGQDPVFETDLSRLPHKVVDGVDLWSWKPRSADGVSSSSRLYATSIQHTYLVVSDDPQNIIGVSGSLREHADQRAGTQPTVPDWKSFSRHEYWLYRRMPRKENGAVNGTESLGSNIKALTYYVDVEKRVGMLRVIDGTEHAPDTSVFLSTPMTVGFRDVSPGVWELSVPLTSDASGFDLSSRIMFRFGFVVIV